MPVVPVSVIITPSGLGLSESMGSKPRSRSPNRFNPTE